MTIRTHTNIHGKCGSGKVFYDKRFDLLWKIGKEQDVSETAKRRLRWFDHYSGSKNAALTCRYFGISESCFWKWKKRFEESRLNGLENRSRKPIRTRQPETKMSTVEAIKQIRIMFPRYGKRKIHQLLTEKISESSIGRVIRRYSMFYRARKRQKAHTFRWGEKQRIKNLVITGNPGEHIEMDTVVLHIQSKTCYIKTAIDEQTKIAFAYVYTRNSSQTSVNFLRKLQYVMPYSIQNIHTDNGSEFLGYFDQELQRRKIPHYFSYPHCPKQHAAIERFNRTLREEFLEEGNAVNDLEMLNTRLIRWLIEYNFHRPHASLDYQNPLAFYDQNFVELHPDRPSSMYWTYTIA